MLIVAFYFDHNATTPVSAEVLEVLLAALRDVYGNASSIHSAGQKARQALDRARLQTAALLGCGPKELIFTSGGTEADNLAILGFMRQHGAAGRHIVTTAMEHPAVLNACVQLEREGAAATYLAPSGDGLVSAAQVENAMRPETALVSVMHANNETGALQPIAEIAAVAKARGAVMHSDGVQAAGKVAVAVEALGVDLYSISGHKFGAPKGVGALYARAGISLQPLQFGGRHERERRAGTENVPGLVALGEAAERAAGLLPESAHRLGALRDLLERGILARVADTQVNAGDSPRTPNTTNIRFAGIEGEALVIALDLAGFAVSTGAACSSGAVQPSHVLTSMGLSAADARSSLRFSLGAGNDAAQVQQLIEALAAAAARLRKLSPVYSHAG